MSSLRAAAREALARKKGLDAKRGSVPSTEAVIQPTTASNVAVNKRAAQRDVEEPKLAAQKPKASRWGSDDDEDDEEEDDGVADGARTAEDPATTGEKAYMEKMLAEANSFAAAQRDRADGHQQSNDRKKPAVVDPRQFLAPSPSASDEENVRLTSDQADPEELVNELSELASVDDAEEHLMAGPSRPSTIELADGDELDEDIAGPARPPMMSEVSEALKQTRGHSALRKLNIPRVKRVHPGLWFTCQGSLNVH